MVLRHGGGVMTWNLDSAFERYPEIMNVAEVAELLRMTKPGTYKWVHSGAIPAYKIEGTWFIFRDELKATLRKGTNVIPPPESHDEG